MRLKRVRNAVLFSLPLQVMACADGGVLFSPSSESLEEQQAAESLTLEELNRALPELGIDSLEEIDLTPARIDELAMAHIKSQQYFKGVPVFGGGTTVHLEPNGALSSLENYLIKDLDRGLRVIPSLSEEAAIKIAKKDLGERETVTQEPIVDLWVLRYGGKDRLAYRVQLEQIDEEGIAAPVVFVDAHSGERLDSYSNVHFADGQSNYSGTVPIGTHQYPDQYVYASGTWLYGPYALEDRYWRVATLDNGSIVPDMDNYWDTPSQRSAIDAQYGTQKAVEYYWYIHNRPGIDADWGPRWGYSGYNGDYPMFSVEVNRNTQPDGTSDPNNAWWFIGPNQGAYLHFGSGAGDNGPLTTLDVVGHEYTHGLISYTSNLTYSGESGALNESFADVFGAMIERYVYGESTRTWRLAEDSVTISNGKNDAMRYLEDPQLNNLPDHYSAYWIETSFTRANDWGRVHSNSSIANKAFYLAAKGGAHRLGGSIFLGIGADAAAAIWYRALTYYLYPSAGFLEMRQATLNAARDLYGLGSTQYNIVDQAWMLCGVGIVDSFNLVQNGRLDNANQWSFSAMAGWANPGYATLAGGNSTQGTMSQTVSIPANAAVATLSFLLRETTTETTTTYPFDYLYVEAVSSNGSVTNLATYSNLNARGGAYAGRFFTSGAINLTQFRGQTITLRFRATNDASYPTTFDIDNVSVMHNIAAYAKNGGFEGSLHFWAATGEVFPRVIFATPHSGSRDVALGGKDSKTGMLYQTIYMPVSGNHSVTFWAKVATAEGTTTQVYDTLRVELADLNGNPISPSLGVTLSNLNSTSYQQYTIPFSSGVGSFRLKLTATTDGSLPSTFYVDDVSVQ